MASSTCWKCLSRPSLTNASSYTTTNTLTTKLPPLLNSFSTSSTLLLQSPKGSGKSGNERAATTLRIKKKAFVKTGRPPAPGERKALRKRIVLSNANALEVESMAELVPELESAHVGQVMGLPGPLVDQLRAVEAFKTTQGWGMFRRPAVLVREETVKVTEMLRGAQEGKTTSVVVVDGARGTGKSMMLLQAMATAFQMGWVVVNIPEAQDLTTAMTDYAPIPGTNPQTYSQPTYTAALLSQLAKANGPILSSLTISLDHPSLPAPLPATTTLLRLAELGARDPDVAQVHFQALWAELTCKSPNSKQTRPPILLTLDGLHHIMRPSAYRSPDFELIHAHDLALVRHVVGYLSGSHSLPNGGAVWVATSAGNTPKAAAVEIAVAEREAGRAIKDTKLDPYVEVDKRALEGLEAVEVMRLKGLSKVEARGLMEYWAASGVLRERVDERSVAEKWTLAGNGVVGEIERSALKMRM